MAFRGIVHRVDVIAVDGIDVLGCQIHVFRAGVPETARGFGVLEIRDLACPKRQVVRGVIDHHVARGMTDRLASLALVQRLVQDIRGDQKGISKQERQSPRLIVLLPEA